MHIQRKGSKDKAFSEAKEHLNRRIASPHARVEQAFDGLAQLGAKMLRSICLERATLHVNWKAKTYNLRRFVYLMRTGTWRSDAKGGMDCRKWQIRAAEQSPNQHDLASPDSSDRPLNTRTAQRAR